MEENESLRIRIDVWEEWDNEFCFDAWLYIPKTTTDKDKGYTNPLQMTSGTAENVEANNDLQP